MLSKPLRHSAARGLAVASIVLGFSSGALPAGEPGAVRDAVALVAASERSAHFDAVARRLELGGTLFGYVDVDGDLQRIAAGIRDLLGRFVAGLPDQAAVLQQDFAGIASDLGLTDVKAIGLSSVALAGGAYRNTVYLHAPDGRHGLLAGLGGGVAPFAHLGLAPATADLYAEGEVDLPAVYAAVRAVVVRIAGEEAAQTWEAQLAASAAPAGFSPLDLIQHAKGRMAIVAQLENRPSLVVPGAKPVALPGLSLLLRFDGIAPVLAPLLAQVPIFTRTEESGRVCYEMQGPLPFGGWKPLVAVEGDALLIATSRAWFDSCLKPKTPLAQQPAFQQTLAMLGGAVGNGLVYVSPRTFQILRRIPEWNADSDPAAMQVFDLVLGNLPQIDAPLMSVRVNLPEGVLFRSLRDRSLKQDIAMLAVYNPMTVGMTAAMAIPAFQKVRRTSQEKTIYNNLRQLWAASQQFYLEHSAEETTYDQLVGPEPEKYIRQLESVAGEDYRAITFQVDQPLRVYTADGREFVYPDE